MPNESWWPSFALRLIFQHTVVGSAITISVFILTHLVGWAVPAVRDIADLIDQLVLLAVLVILAVELVGGLIVDLLLKVVKFFRGNGINAIITA